MFIALVAVFLAYSPAQAQRLIVAGDYHLGCQLAGDANHWSEVPIEHEATARACIGVVSMLLFTGRERGICPPAPVTRQHAAGVVAQYLDENPQVRLEEFRSAAEVALTTAYPCEALD
jgi:hypothetical protein